MDLSQQSNMDQHLDSKKIFSGPHLENMIWPCDDDRGIIFTVC